MDIVKYIQHPELLDRETLYPLRELVAKYPYFQAARLLFLHNLFLLHDPTFGEELRRASLYIPDRNVLFQLVEGDNYKPTCAHANQTSKEAAQDTGRDRTESLINKFLQTSEPYTQETHKRQPTATDATTDYAAFLLQMEDAQPEQQETPPQRGLDLIDDFIENQTERIVLNTKPEHEPEPQEIAKEQPEIEEDYFTETLAKIYIQQGRYEKAIEIIRKLHLVYPKKNRYFADQIRFLQKLEINNKNKT